MMTPELEAARKHLIDMLEYRSCDPELIGKLADIALDAGQENKARELQEAKAIAHKIRENINAIDNLRSKEEILDKEIDEAHKRCPHPETIYRPDATRNNDSITECLCCGAYL